MGETCSGLRLPLKLFNEVRVSAELRLQNFHGHKTV